ncbi:MAG: type II toxin-antitoxin system RelE/ParE family toxin [Rhodocyclaceae bacterium]|nr:type II toxin-antitoxin system RelE/ParE family toxin [Rhodocyclaceae bacterium]
MYAVEYSSEAARVLERMPRNVAEMVVAKIEQVAAAPYEAPNVKKLAGSPAYRLRVGQWRVIYSLNDGLLLVSVLKIGARGGIYK